MSRKGIPNRTGAAVKSNVLAVFDKIGGRETMANWAKENLTEFYKLYARLIPTEVVADVTFHDAADLSESELIAIATSGGVRAVIEAPSPDEPGEVH